MVERDNSPLAETKPKIFYGYFIVVAAFFVLLLCTGTLTTFGVFFEPLIVEFGWTRALTSGAFSLYSVLSGSLSVVMGGLTDRFGPRLVLTACGLFLGAGYMLMSQINAVWQLYLFYGVIVAVGLGAGTIPAISLVARWFIKRRAMMTGIVMAGMGSGAMVLPLLASWLITNYGWRTAYTIQGGIALVLVVAAAQFLKRDPSQVGQLPLGADQLDSEVKEDNSSSEAGGLSLRQAVRTRQFWLVCVLSFCLAFGASTVMVHVVIAATGVGIAATSAAAILSVRGGLQATGQLVLGGTADRIGNGRVLTFGFILMSAALIWLLFAEELWMFCLFAAVFGFALGSWAAAPPLVSELFGTMSHGLFMGFAFFSSSLGNTVGPVMAGYIFDATGSYQIAWYMAIGVVALGVIVSLLIRRAGIPVVAGNGK